MKELLYYVKPISKLQYDEIKAISVKLNKQIYENKNGATKTIT